MLLHALTPGHLSKYGMFIQHGGIAGKVSFSSNVLAMYSPRRHISNTRKLFRSKLTRQLLMSYHESVRLKPA